MKAIPPTLFQMIGYLTNGDIGPWTFYTSTRGRLVFFPKTYPKDPATYHQTLYRNKWRHAGLRWQLLDQTTKDLWELAAKRNHLTVSGFNLFIFYILGNHTKYIETIERISNVDLQTPTGPPLPAGL